jgi:hypothetical protein
MARFAFPYPVLGAGDTIEGGFNVSLKLTRAENKKVTITVCDIDITNNEISKLLENEQCRVLLRIYCSSTFYSDSFTLTKDLEIEIPEENLINRVEAEIFIVLNMKMTYSLKTFKDEYTGMSFNLNRNDVIGVSDVSTWDIPRSYEKLTSNSIFKFTMRQEDCDSSVKDLVSFNFDNDDIHVVYPFYPTIDPLSAMFRKKMYTAYWSTVIPALTEGYKIILSEDEELKSEYLNYRWFHYLEQVKKIKGLSSQDPFEIAQSAFVKGGFINMFEELS